MRRGTFRRALLAAMARFEGALAQRLCARRLRAGSAREDHLASLRACFVRRGCFGQGSQVAGTLAIPFVKALTAQVAADSTGAARYVPLRRNQPGRHRHCRGSVPSEPAGGSRPAVCVSAMPPPSSPQRHARTPDARAHAAAAGARRCRSAGRRRCGSRRSRAVCTSRARAARGLRAAVRRRGGHAFAFGERGPAVSPSAGAGTRDRETGDLAQRARCVSPGSAPSSPSSPARQRKSLATSRC